MRRPPRSQRTTISKATRRGNLAWTSGAHHGTVMHKDGATMNLVGRHTAIWAKRGADWIIVHGPPLLTSR